ncbi:hypothetical protein MLD38_032003 [Melastoma candidum]|uniref:Uncharacterized protein n=1 Tax=Melastoma candidum TaxID=119954 RepID=A0ACB9MT59_9MYRT|nr:hypothetical protein MLD38_032003 [Melastoma candidum]
MINGEGASAGASNVDSPDQPDGLRDTKSDGGEDSLSRYSSCEGSELEQYSSANSVMGTPSLRSSSSVAYYSDCFGNSDFGSFRSVGFLDDGGLEGFNLGGRIDSRTNAGDDCTVLRIEPRLLVNDQDIKKETKLTDGAGNVQDEIEFSGGHGCEEEERQGLSPDGQSEDRDSILDNGSENEHGGDFACLSNTRRNRGRMESDFDSNTLLMNSSVAFGSGDWDGFTLETAEGSCDPLMLKEMQLKREASYNNVEDFLKDLRMPWEELQNDEEINSSYVAHCTDPVAFSGRTRTSGTGDVPWGRGNIQSLSIEDEKENNGMPLANCTGHTVIDESEGCADNCSVMNVFEPGQESTPGKSRLELGIKLDATKPTWQGQYSLGSMDQLTGIQGSLHLEGANGKDLVGRFSSQDGVKSHQNPRAPEIVYGELQDNFVTSSTSVALSTHHHSELKDLAFSKNLPVDQTLQEKNEALELNGFVDDVIHEMEEILLDVGESPQFPRDKKKLSESKLSSASRDAGSTASTSGNEGDVDAINQKILRVEGVEVIGARQKKGEVSFSERLVGVKEYTVYRIKVWGSDSNWEVERRYRDFFTLYRQMKALFSSEGWVLPAPWSLLHKESRKIFGSSSPDVVAERSEIIQECLHSVIHYPLFSDLPPCLIWFLSPEDSFRNLSKPSGLIHPSTFSSKGTDVEILSPLGKTISLVVEVHPQRSLMQLLEAQHYRCAGCHRHFDDKRNLMRDFMQTLGWGKPRLCEYTGQLFCHVCHTNETVVLPARVLHFWDFTEYPVCQLSKSYLDSIRNQPMLCVSAVNPFLLTRVPALLHVTTLRKKIGSMLLCIRCPFRGSVNRGLGSRKYLLEVNDFFSLRDLIDLSKGPFAAVPVMLETVSKKIREHVMERCLVCCDVGVPCAAKQACTDPSSLIFPFQENEVEKCRHCQALYHQKCFDALGKCPCRLEISAPEVGGSFKRNNGGSANEASGIRNLQSRRSGSPLLSEIFPAPFPKSKSVKVKHSRERDTLLRMGSLPSTYL